MMPIISASTSHAHILPQLQETRGLRGKNPYFSVIICTFNRRGLVLATLASLRRQTLPYELFEVIVVDNGSLDHTFEALNAYIHNYGEPYDTYHQTNWQVRCLRETRNGQAFARNSGLRVARGHVVVFLDDDTLADPHFLAQLLRAYEECGADAISGRVELLWEAKRPYWLGSSLLSFLGYFAPDRERIQLPSEINLNSCCFSIKRAALLDVGLPSFTLSKRLNAPAQMAVFDLSQRLRKAGYSLWYEPEAQVLHRVQAERLKQPFFIGRAYWQGRAEELARYFEGEMDPSAFTSSNILQEIQPVLHEIASIEWIEAPLISLARQPTHERLLAHMTQARLWGGLQQRLEIMERVPHEVSPATVLFIHNGVPHVERMVQHLRKHGLLSGSSKEMARPGWLWRHRTYMGQSAALIHIYNPGKLHMGPLKRLHFRLLLFLAHLLGIRIISTDSGGCWQYISKRGFRAARRFEQQVFAASDVVLSYTPHKESLYDESLLPRVHYLPHPGLRGLYPLPVPRQQALEQLGLPIQGEFTFLCLANMHTEREVIQLIRTFTEMRKSELPLLSEEGPQLLIVGSPCDCLRSKQVLKLAALDSAIHLFMENDAYQEVSPEDLPLCIGAADALIIPHFAPLRAGICEMAMLLYSYGRIVVAPDLPRFRDILPHKASILYNPAQNVQLLQALRQARRRAYTLTEQEKRELTVDTAWEKYTHQLLDLYHYLLAGSL